MDQHRAHDAMRTLGQAHWGREWRSPMARVLGVSPRTMFRWLAGDPIPDHVLQHLLPLARAARQQLVEEQADRLAALQFVITTLEKEMKE